jgi:hypothetical protein
MSRFGKTAQPVVSEELTPPVKIDISAIPKFRVPALMQPCPVWGVSMGVIQRTFCVEADLPLQFSTAFLPFLTWMLGSGPILRGSTP